MNRLRDLAVDGALLALPLGAVAYLLHKVIGLLSELLVPIAHLLPQGHLMGIAALDVAAVVLLFVALVVLGAFARSSLGRRLAQALEQLVLSKIPFYLVVKSMVADVSSAAPDSGMRPALVEFDDNTVLGFVVEQADAGDMVTVFIPDAPAAASGNVVLVLGERVQPLDVATGAAMRTMKQRGLGLQALTQAKAVHSSRASARPAKLPTPRWAEVRPTSP
jgi:uncharacterized membrane protein